MQFYQEVLTVTVVSTGLFNAYDLIGFDGAKVTTDDALVLGGAKSPSTEIGQPTGIIAMGVLRVKAVGAITLGARVMSAAAGGVKVVGATPANPIGRALNAAADGEFVTVLKLS
ncbi:hypothetical protein GCM10010873_16470 [Cypionkella aquatica]|uniref:Uncharacterized protein n=1 Tax=Cypionkella aquatica TaxID=1756042 RepID=A0AA37WZI5_9RHOB|nr:capsid cement protein [Cypionkella aquatica]GLS86673.1 hypothetical protein GCM10010873_16470 [Cypionkella aquatica]